MESYEPKKIEKKWQDKWDADNLYTLDAESDKSKYFALVEFPYPSGNLHVGHWYAFSVPDIRARFKRMQGYDVIFPIGYDSFGLPAENAAIKRGLDPKGWTESNMETMKTQLRSMGAMFDWDRMVATSDSSFYKWTQWMFTKFHEKGLVYRALTAVNWCPSCKTVLANEQVVSGECERCGAPVEKKEMSQWMLKITAYADRLIDDLDGLDWPKEIKDSQKNWIGRSEGAEFSFEVKSETSQHFVLVHGYKASPDLNFHTWLKSELEKRGHTVEVPELPNPREPDVVAQAQYVLENTSIDENTVLLGHSLGTNVVMRVLEKLEQPVKRTVLVGGFIDDGFADEKDRDVSFDFNFDITKIKENAGQIILLHGENEETISSEQFDNLHRKLGGQSIVGLDNKEHFRGEVEPAVLKAVLPHIPVFTTRPDTLYGATYMVVAPEHPLVDQLQNQITNWSKVEEYRKQAAAKTDLDRQQDKNKTGVPLAGVTAVNPANGEEIPVWIADYVLAGYGTGAIMAVPAHDERDQAFAEKFEIEIRSVVDQSGKLHNSGDFDGLSSEEAKAKITEFVGGRMKTTFKQRDWGISRQRYWGTPIPVVYDPSGKAHMVPEEHLPWKLPEDVDHTPDGTAPLARSKELKKRTEDIFGEGWTPEYDTMDTFVDSTWYFMRYLDPKNESSFADKELLEKWLPVDMYSGGSDHTTMHVLYSRFWYKALADLGYVPGQEPYTRRLNRGWILGPDGKKMSKSKGNVVDPDIEVSRFGADSVRTYLAFIGPYNEVGNFPWNTDGLAGVRRFLEKVWRIAEKVSDSENSELSKILHQTIKKVESDLEAFKTNTAVAQLMICANSFDRAESVGRDQYKLLLRLLSPFAPHITEELWQSFETENSIHVQEWPSYKESLLIEDSISIAIQVNGKLRDVIDLPINSVEETVRESVLKLEKIKTYVADEDQIKRFIFVPNKLVNIVI